MKIADVSEFYSEQGGGVRTYVQQKLAAAARLGHTLVVIAPGPETVEEPRPGGKILWVKAPPLPVDPRYHMFTSAAGIHAALDREAPDVVEGSSPWRGGWIAGHWPGLPGRRCIRTLVMHADPVAVYAHTFLGGLLSRPVIDRAFGWFWSYLRRLNRPFNATVVAGDWLARRFEGFGLRGLHSVPFGIDRTVFHGSLRDTGLRRKMLAACGLADDAFLLLTVGRHHPEKRLPTLIEAVRLANLRPAGKRVGLFLVGDGLARRQVDRAASKVPGVHVAGLVSEQARIAAMMASADGFLHGSGCETFGLAVAEALCCGAPIIVPDAGGAYDLAAPDYAEVYPLGSAAGAAEAIHRAAARDQATMAAAALTAAAARIGNPETHFDRLFALYESLLAQAR